MKILAFNGSPRGKQGNTEVLIRLFLEGCRQAGAETETIYLKEKNIHSCSGCFTCWTKTPGSCIHKDDMKYLLDKLLEADIIVYGTPLYYFTYTGIMKNFIDRQLPLVDRKIVCSDHGYTHNARNPQHIKTIKNVLISNCGFPGKNHFSGLLETFKVWHKDSIAGTILVSQGGVLSSIDHDEYLTKLYTPLIQSLKNAGKEVVTLGHINPETQKLLDTEYMPDEVYAENANVSWDN